MDAVEGDHDGLRVLELEESALVEEWLLRFLVVLGSRYASLVGRCAPAQPTNLCIVARFRDAVADLRLVGLAADFRCETSCVRIRSCQKDLCPEGLHQRLETLVRQCVLQGTDALRGNNGNAFRLARDRKEPLVADRIVAADGGKVLELITDKDRGPIVPIWLGFHPRYAELDGTLVVDLHHRPNGLGQRRVESYGEIEADDLACFD